MPDIDPASRGRYMARLIDLVSFSKRFKIKEVGDQNVFGMIRNKFNQQINEKHCKNYKLRRYILSEFYIR